MILFNSDQAEKYEDSIKMMAQLFQKINIPDQKGLFSWLIENCLIPNSVKQNELRNLLEKEGELKGDDLINSQVSNQLRSSSS